MKLLWEIPLGIIAGAFVAGLILGLGARWTFALMAYLGKRAAKAKEEPSEPRLFVLRAVPDPQAPPVPPEEKLH